MDLLLYIEALCHDLFAPKRWNEYFFKIDESFEVTPLSDNMTLNFAAWESEEVRDNVVNNFPYQEFGDWFGSIKLRERGEFLFRVSYEVDILENVKFDTKSFKKL